MIPHYVVSEIHDAYPAKNGTKYVGFKHFIDAVTDNIESEDVSTDKLFFLGLCAILGDSFSLTCI